MDDPRRRLVRASGWLPGVALACAGACAGPQSSSTYQDQQQAMFYADLLNQQAQAQQAAASQPVAPTTATQPATPDQQAALAAAAIPGETIIGRAAGRPISAAALAAHQALTGLSRPAAFADLVDLTLLRAAAALQGIAMAPDPVSPEARAEVERSVADSLNLAMQPGEALHPAVRDRLLEGKTIEILDETAR